MKVLSLFLTLYIYFFCTTCNVLCSNIAESFTWKTILIPHYFPFPLFKKNGERGEGLLNATTRRDASGAIVGVVGVGQDITDRKNAETIFGAIADEIENTGVHPLDARVFMDEDLADEGIMVKGKDKTDPRHLEHGLMLQPKCLRR